MERINCRNCKHFFITWDRNFPNGCRAYGIKSREMPAVVVYKSSGNNCMIYNKKHQ